MKIGRFLDSTPRWQHQDAAIRLRAIAEDSLDQPTLLQLAQGDADDTVKVAATGQLTDHQDLEHLVQSDNPAISSAAARRWVALLSDMAPEDAVQRLEECQLPQLIVTCAGQANGVELRLAAVALISADATLLELLRTDNNSQVLQACASKLENEALLEEVRTLYLGKDKNVLRIVRDKLNRLREAREQALALNAQCDSLADRAEKLAGSEYHEMFDRYAAALQAEWSALQPELDAAATATSAARIEQALARCFDILRRIPEERERLEAEVQAVTERITNLCTALERELLSADQIATELSSIMAACPPGTDNADLALGIRRIRALLTQLRNASAVNPADTNLTRLSASLARVSWPEGFPRPDHLDLAQAQLERLVAEHDRAEQFRVDIDGRLAKLASQIEAGESRAASKTLSNLNRKLGNVKDKPTTAQKDLLARLSQALRDLKDWQGFATTPKRLELCEKMEALARETAIHPAEKATAIKELQETWKTLGPSDYAEGQLLWSRFREAADLAFKPCAEFFQQQREAREQNVLAREGICAELEAFNLDHNWDAPDYKQVADLISSTLRRWRDHEDIPRGRFKKLQNRFTAALDPLQAKLKAEQEKNRERKVALIEQLTDLLATDNPDVNAAINAAKSAQQAWKTIGVTERRVDQKLWKAFRKQCDLVFALRDQARDAAKQEAQAARGRAGEVATRFAQAIKTGEVTRGSIKAFRAEFDALLPRGGEQRGLEKEFRDLVGQAEKRIRQQAKDQTRHLLSEVRRRGLLCRQQESGAATPEQVDAEWEGDITLPPDIQAQLDQRRQQATTADSKLLAANLEAAALLCVRIEILADMESPADAKTLRMQYQVERLNRELSQGQKETRTPDQQLSDLIMLWHCTGPLPASAAPLIERFERAEKKLSSENRQ
ncbi:MAG: DUF349 domain-containing protein [Pseudomonadota bacterium]